MQFTREIQRLLLAVLLVFGLISITATYWAAVGPETILKRNDNARLFEFSAAILRGDIVDRNGVLLAQSSRSANRTAVRTYFYPETSALVGYYSLRYGVGGIEAVYDSLLAGSNTQPNFQTYFRESLLHLPRRGTSIQLTLDALLQQQLVNDMAGHTGAAVLLSVPDGAVLALVSLPTFDPNTLDTNWEMLTAAPGNPFFNRALQGIYQPGGILHIPLIVAALPNTVPLTTFFENADEVLEVGNAALGCTVPPPSGSLTLREVFIYGCPAPFAQVYQQLGEARITAAFDLFRFDQPMSPQGFNLLQAPNPAADSSQTSEYLTLADALGQGHLTTTPMNIAIMMAAIINNGNAPQPFALVAVRPPDSGSWSPASSVRSTIPIMTAQNADRLRTLLRESAASGSASAAARPGIDIGGTAARAYSGSETLVWFAGFASTGSGQGYVIAIVLENTDDFSLVASIGGAALEAAVRASPAAQNSQN